jgi:gliding motility-associated-like protein
MVDSMSRKDQMHKCYRIRAVGNANGLQRSLSNESCIELESSFWAPNAFTPNNDSINDLFYFPGEYQADATMQVFDRWGHKLTEITGRPPKWDGQATIGRDKYVPEGTYLCLLTGIGLDGRVVNMRAWVTLLR